MAILASYLSLTPSEFYRRTRSELCRVVGCGNSGGGLTSVTTSNSASVTFSGDGTSGNPLSAVASGSSSTLSDVLTNGNTANNTLILSNGTLSTTLVTSGIQLSGSGQSGTYTRAYTSYTDSGGNVTTIEPNPSLPGSIILLYPTSGGTLALKSDIPTNYKFAQNSSVTITSVTPTSIIGSGTGILTIPANTLIAGSLVKFSISGIYSTTGSPTTGTLSFKLGSSAVINIDSAFPTPRTNQVWSVDIMLSICNNGVSGHFALMGSKDLGETYLTTIPISNTSCAFTIDTTVNNLVDAIWTWGETGHSITSLVAIMETNI